MNTIAEVPIDAIGPHHFARLGATSGEDDAALHLSVATQGVVQPLLLRQHGNQMVLLKGQRRLDAARAAGLTSVPAAIFAADDPRSDAEIVAASMVRAPLNPVDRWRAMQAMLDAGRTLETAAAALGITPQAGRRLTKLAHILPEILEHLAASLHSWPNDRDVQLIATASPETQAAAWKTHGKRIRDCVMHRHTVPWWDLARACHVESLPRNIARFDDDAAARHGIVWEEDLFAPAGADSRHTTNVAGFRAAQQEWMEAQVAQLLAEGFQAEMLKPGPHGMTIPKGMQHHGGDAAKAPKRVIRGFWMDASCVVQLELYSRPKAPEKPSAKPAPADDASDADEAPAALPKPEPRGLSKRGLVLVAEAQEATLRETLGRHDEWETTPGSRDFERDTAALLQALLLALTADNVRIGGGEPYTLVELQDALEGMPPRDAPAALELPALHKMARQVLAAMLHAPRPGFAGSGGAFADVCATLGVMPPRLDTEEILAELPRDQLAEIAELAGVKAGTRREMARKLAGEAPDWQPVPAWPALRTAEDAA